MARHPTETKNQSLVTGFSPPLLMTVMSRRATHPYCDSIDSIAQKNMLTVRGERVDEDDDLPSIGNPHDLWVVPKKILDFKEDINKMRSTT
ncbi:2681_t:CDS:2 [Acaulospora colombiana]|uniref:2681_t:CDS:1 n=1 Tax=Acaulospora colombiana TaxID=27376 RepID=A0ACA9MDM8_9GLOM|nr:2681_t:CDS:2 [Acaulospora colombiana]